MNIAASPAAPRWWIMIAWLKDFARQNRSSIAAYLSMVGGSAGRLVISLVYFIAIANTLSIGDFGLFATASACGIMLSRLLAFGFVSPLYRIATVKSRLLGAYTAGFAAGAVLSAPLIVIAAWITHQLIFADDMAIAVFSRIILAEVVCWRIMEISVIVSYGVNRFASGSVLVIVATALKTAAAVLFAWLADGSLAVWSGYYLTANALAALTGLVFFYPRVRLRWKPVLYLRRWSDAVSVAGAEMLFYIQSELDKVLVLSLGGPVAAGIYAMIMRLVDLTALPVRAFLTVLTQRLMRDARLLESLKNRIMLEGAVAAVSTAGILAMSGFLWIFPNALGSNVAEAAPLLILVALVPGLRNLLEYHSELLYATGRTVVRMLMLAFLAIMKALLLALVLSLTGETETWIELLNPAFLALYLLSATVTYRALRSFKRRAI